MTFRIGLDIGSTSVNAVVIGADGNILDEHYRWCHGRPFRKSLKSIIKSKLWP